MLNVDLVPLLPTQRAIYDIPRGPLRFQTYLHILKGDSDDVLLPPLVFLNPMGKDKAPALVDALLALDAEAVAADALAETRTRLPDIEAEFRIGLVVVDDVQGGWTNRGFTEIEAQLPVEEPPPRRMDLGALLDVGNPDPPETVRQEIFATLYRTLYLRRHGAPRTLRQRMTQESLTAAFAGQIQPGLDDADLAYSREIIALYLDGTDLPIIFACLYGDASAKAVGYTPLGLSPRAGYAVARDDARSSREAPERFL